MARMATDVVLLPDETMTDQVIELNKRLVRAHSSEIALNRRDCLPHVSLAMGCIEKGDLEAIQEVLKHLANQSPLRQLTATGVQASTNSRGATTSVLEIERTAELQTLHEQVMDEMRPFFSYDATGAVFYDDAVAESTLDWVRNYPQKAGYESFSPHITLGYGQVQPAFPLPAVFTVARLALCHLGNHATCRKILAAVDLPLKGE
jgi:2'-5' RNA ligase